MSSPRVAGESPPEPVADGDVRHYLGLPYGIVLDHDDADDGPVWHALVDELPGCEATGTTPVEAVERVPAALAEWVSDALSHGRAIPEPRPTRSYSGKLLLRMPLSLHAALARAADRDQVSLNAYITSQLAVAVAWRRPQAGPAPAAPKPPEPSRDRLLWWALVVNLSVVGVAAVIAIALLITAWAGS